jgi:hypothetical protein
MPKIILKDGSEFIVDQAILEENILPAQPDEMIQLGKTYFKKSSIEIIHDDDLKRPPVDTIIPSKKTKEPSGKIEGFSFWLNLLGVGIVLTPLSIIFSVVLDMEAYDALGIFINFLLVIAYIWLSYLMIQRKKIFKKAFIIIGLLQVIILGLIAIGANSESSLYSASELSEINSSFGRSIFLLIVWTLYLIKSKKIKKIFIN